MEWQLWQTILAPLIVAAIAGAIGLVWPRVSGLLNGSRVKASIEVMELPNPLDAVDYDQKAELEKAIRSAFALSNIKRGILPFSSVPQLVFLAIENRSNQRAKEIEIITKDDALIVCGDTQPAVTLKAMSLSPVDPHTKIKAYIVPLQILFNPEKGIIVLHDGIKVPIQSHVVPGDFKPFIALVNKYPKLVRYAIICTPLLLAWTTWVLYIWR